MDEMKITDIIAATSNITVWNNRQICDMTLWHHVVANSDQG